MLSFMRQHQMPAPNSRLLVALSGGRDSVVLLHLLMEVGYIVEAAHMNFGLRGAESDEDELFVTQLTNELGVKCHIKRVDLPAFKRSQKISVQEAARQLRYDWFDDLLKKQNMAAIAVGHHQDDSIETLIINLIRGTGLRGLAGIKPINGKIIRPMLFAKSHEIERYAQEKGFVWRNDSSNLKDDYLRNRIRLHLLPMLRTLVGTQQGGIENSLQMIAAQAGLYSVFANEFRKVWLEAIDNGVYRIDASKVKQYGHATAVLYELLAPFGFNTKQVQQMEQALWKPSGKVFNAGQYRVYFKSNVIEISQKPQQVIESYPVFPDTPAECPLVFEFNEWHIGDKFSTNPKEAWLDFDTLVLPLSLRSPKRGDRFMPLGMMGTQKLSDYFTNHHFSLFEKSQTLVLVDAQGNIVWLCGHRIAHPYRITKNTRKVLTVKFREGLSNRNTGFNTF